MSFHKILVANRGEIALRVMRTARTLGYRTVAVFSDADAQAPFVQQADEAVRIGPAAAAESYLNIPALLAAARASGADAVHPGYGFLSERADFAQACADAGLVFIGPPPSAITAMGDKALAKRRMMAAGVPCAPGYLGDAQDDASLQQQAALLGYPLLVKAVAGGGGRGMRLVHQADDLPQALAGARREAHNAFGDGTLMLERLITPGRHIEIQVFADSHGNAVHLGERDCTAQRRRQKLIEETPSPIVSADLRARMGADSVAAALAVAYVGAGTVEFIVDAQGRHYFLEMNTRLQVEHPVTELVTGLDLVAWQLRVAAGEALPLAQAQIRFSGHAIEARLYAEDPYDGFKPQTGRITHWQPDAALHPGVRIDHGITQGGEVTPWYDAMVAKVIAHGHNRADAIRRLRAALADAPLMGVVNNGRFLHDLLADPAFANGQMHTTLIDDWAAQGQPLLQRPVADDTAWLLAAVLRAGQADALRPASLGGWHLQLAHQGRTRRFLVSTSSDGLSLTLDGITHQARVLASGDHRWRVELDGVQRHGVAHTDGDTLTLAWQAANLVFDEPSPWPDQANAVDASRVLSPVAGVVAQLAVAVGDVVAAGQPLVCVEAMKMELWQHASAAGTVREVPVQLRQSVAQGALLVQLELSSSQEPQGPT
jgi:geranyl-CoA carboxylase alpha subunit